MWKFARLFLCGGVLFSGCCTDRLEFSGAVEVRVYEADDGGAASGPVADTVRGPFRYEALALYVYAAAQPLVRPAQLLMAMDCGEVVDNEVVAASVRLSLDRTISLGAVSVPAGDDLIPVLQAFDSPNDLVDILRLGTVCYFDERLLEVSDIPAGAYTFTFSANLEDGTPITDVTSVYLVP